MRSSYYLGVSLYRGQIQIAELDHGKKKTVTALAERSTSIDFNRDTHFSPDHPQIFTFVYELEELLKENRVHSKSISFAIPIEPILLNVVPVDPSLHGPELTAHAQWEFAQYYPKASVKDYSVSAIPIAGAKNAAKEVFLVGVRRGLIGFFKRAASELRLQTHLIDVDHFSVEKTLKFCHPELTKDAILLLGLRGGAVDASLVIQGEFADYRTFPIETLDDLKKSIVAYRQHLSQKDDAPNPSKIVLYGYGATQNAMNQIQKETGIPTMTLDAIRNLVPSKKLFEAYAKDSSRFAAAVGLARFDTNSAMYL